MWPRMVPLIGGHPAAADWLPRGVGLQSPEVPPPWPPEGGRPLGTTREVLGFHRISGFLIGFLIGFPMTLITGFDLDFLGL